MTSEPTEAEVEAVVRAIDEWTERALETHGRFNTVELARAAIQALIRVREGKG